MDDVTLRQATEDDGEFFFTLHEASFGPYVDQIWGWDDDAQRAYLSRNLDLARVRVIVVGGVDVGRLDVVENGDEIFLALIELTPDCRGNGIGSLLIGNLLERAREAGKRVRLNVLEVNTAAHRLYRRLGFTELGREVDGPAIRIRMIGP